jgi:hypothetical protein
MSISMVGKAIILFVLNSTSIPATTHTRAPYVLRQV